MTIAEAIAHQEGFYVQGSRAQRNNNPGNVVAGTFALHYGCCGSDRKGIAYGEPGFAIFPTIDDGWRCLEAVLGTPRYRGRTVEQMVAIYAPASDGNDIAAYTKAICEMTGLKPTDTLL